MKLLLFDIDGTLLISNGVGREAKYRSMIEMFGTDQNVRTHPFGGKTDWQLLYELIEPLGYSVEQVGELMPTYELLMGKNTREALPHFQIELLPNVMPLLTQLRKREDILLGIVTGNTSKSAPVKLEAVEIDPTWFKANAYGNEAYSRNDLPKLAIERAEALLGESIDPQDVIVIGNTVADIECAWAVNAVAVAVRTGYEADEKLIEAQPDYLLDDLHSFIETVL